MSGRAPGGRPAPQRTTARAGSRPAAGRAAARPAADGRSSRPVARIPAARERGTPATGVPRAAAPAREGTATVSSTSAARFAARVRRRRRQRVAVVLGALAGGLGLGWLVFASPVLAVRDVQVRGVKRLSAAEVEVIASRQLGRSMALASPRSVAEQVIELRLVRAAQVDRSWPSTLVVTVTEREPIVAVPVAAGRVQLLDGDGVVVDTVPRAKAGVPVVEVNVERAGAESLRAARAVVDDVPPALRAGMRMIRATSPDDVTLVLGDGSTVIWGSAQDGDRKAAALLAVHPRPTKHPVDIDVSAPDAPAVTDR